MENDLSSSTSEQSFSTAGPVAWKSHMEKKLHFLKTRFDHALAIAKHPVMVLTGPVEVMIASEKSYEAKNLLERALDPANPDAGVDLLLARDAMAESIAIEAMKKSGHIRSLGPFDHGGVSDEDAYEALGVTPAWLKEFEAHSNLVRARRDFNDARNLAGGPAHAGISELLSARNLAACVTGEKLPGYYAGLLAYPAQVKKLSAALGVSEEEFTEVVNKIMPPGEARHAKDGYSGGDGGSPAMVPSL